MLLTSHTYILRKMLLSSVLCSRQFFQASLQRTSSTIIILMFENVVKNIRMQKWHVRTDCIVLQRARH